MLDIFASVGGERFCVTWTNSAGHPRRPRSLSRNLQLLGGLLPQTGNEDWDAVHIAGIGAADLGRTIPALAAAMFLIIETSPGNHQAWLAMAGDHDREFARRARRGAGADVTASGATKIAGSLNLKDKYAPDFPRVRIVEAQPGRMPSPDELERMGLVAPTEHFAPVSPRRRFSRGTDKWPIYAKALAGAPRNRDGSARKEKATRCTPPARRPMLSNAAAASVSPGRACGGDRIDKS